MTTLLQIGQSLRAERVHQKKHKTKLAKASGVHRNTLSGLEAGVTNVEMNTLIALCDQLGLDIVRVRKEVAILRVCHRHGRNSILITANTGQRVSTSRFSMLINYGLNVKCCKLHFYFMNAGELPVISTQNFSYLLAFEFYQCINREIIMKLY
ncbi:MULTISPECIES: helix-turn-helix domain-containing protein [Collimonas]|uniref:helix-turn-helix domain-containing protein n=1 Tax=Collimonas TaxID=202907 RepID=UPI000778488D|nr:MULTISPECIES: helix-turn-helix transcriptional regulator [Collimonas]